MSSKVSSGRLQGLTIGQVAKAAGVPTTTLRYYERAGLFPRAQRSASGYRLYGDDAVERLQFIRSAQAVGFALEDVGHLLKLQVEGCTKCRGEVEEMLKKRLAETEERLADLERVRSALRRAVRRCRNSGEECAVIKDLDPKRKRER